MDANFKAPFAKQDALQRQVYSMVSQKWQAPDLAPPGSGSALDRCNSLTTCKSCTAEPDVDGTSCGWCQLSKTVGMCVSGGSDGPTGCKSWRFSTCHYSPPPAPPVQCPSAPNGAMCGGISIYQTNSYAYQTVMTTSTVPTVFGGTSAGEPSLHLLDACCLMPACRSSSLLS